MEPYQNKRTCTVTEKMQNIATDTQKNAPAFVFVKYFS